MISAADEGYSLLLYRDNTLDRQSVSNKTCLRRKDKWRWNQNFDAGIGLMRIFLLQMHRPAADLTPVRFVLSTTPAFGHPSYSRRGVSKCTSPRVSKGDIGSWLVYREFSDAQARA